MNEYYWLVFVCTTGMHSQHCSVPGEKGKFQKVDYDKCFAQWTLVLWTPWKKYIIQMHLHDIISIIIVIIIRTILR